MGLSILRLGVPAPTTSPLPPPHHLSGSDGQPNRAPTPERTGDEGVSAGIEEDRRPLTRRANAAASAQGERRRIRIPLPGGERSPGLPGG